MTIHAIPHHKSHFGHITVNIYFVIFFFGMVIFGLSSCTKQIAVPPINIIPQPVHIEKTDGFFLLKSETNIVINDASLNSEANYLKQLITPATGFKTKIIQRKIIPNGEIYLNINPDFQDTSNEAYTLEVNAKYIIITALNNEGIFRGIQTLHQLLPAELDSDSLLAPKNWIVPCCIVHDYPKYQFRSTMLDVARHFFTVPEVKRHIDLLALYKLNTLHLHLSDDQGWRIEIKSWPKLIEIGGTSSVNFEKPGFYTQDQYAELVNYASERFITIIPEIDMPGHTNAALASYAELNVDKKNTELYGGIEVGFSSLSIHNETTYGFIDDVIRELSAITPGPFLHIGGDESHATKHNDYVYFMNRVLKITKKYHKIAIGWDEMAHANINNNHLIQYWNNSGNANMAVKKGASIILSPAKYTYIDMKYDSTTPIGLSWAGTIEVDKAYQWYPDSLAINTPHNQILGIEAPLWSETLLSNNDIEYLAFPRICGIAELAWSQNIDLNWQAYQVRLAAQKKRFEALKINYYQSPKINW